MLVKNAWNLRWIRVHCKTRQGGVILWYGVLDVQVMLVNIHNGCCTEKQKSHIGGLKRHNKVILSKDWSKVLRIGAGIVTIPLFCVDVPLSSQSLVYQARNE